VKHRFCLVLGLVLMACGAQPAKRVRSVPAVAKPRVESHAQHDARVNAAVQVRGIEGTLSNFDVRSAMEGRGREFGACHEPRAKALPVLAGQIEFAIQVDIDGQVRNVDVRASDLGDRELERCLTDVIRGTRFHKPHGGVANVTWLMALEPARLGTPAEAWEPGRIARVIDKNVDDLRGQCDLATSSGTLTITVYVGSRGRIVAAGVASPVGQSAESLDCVAENLRSWPMPKPRGRYAKVSFVVAGQ